jgi:polysaccharide biosynthesis protein PslH
VILLLQNNDKNFQCHKILFISSCFPYPLDDGMKIRAFHTIRQLVKAGYDVTLICFLKKIDEKNVEKLKHNLNINIVSCLLDEVPTPISRVFYTLFSKNPFYVNFFYKDNFKKKVKQLLDINFDLVYIFDRSMVLYGKNIEVPKILDSVDSPSLGSLSGFKSSKKLLHKVFWYLEYMKSKKIEKDLYPLYDLVFTSAERDMEQLMNLTNSKIVNMPNGVDLNYFKPMDLEKNPYSLVFVGTMDAFSNQQAVLYFVEKVYPTIKQSFPLVKLFIIGKNPSKEILNLNDDKNIFVTGYVEDIRSYLDKCEIIISPLKMATGIQNKILVAMAMNKPIVSTKVSIGGINKFINKNDIIIVKDDDEFAQKIIELFSNKLLLNTIGKNGRNIVKKNYSWESLGYKIDKLIKEVIN